MSERGLNTGTESKVQQQHLDDCLVPNIVKRYNQGEMPRGSNRPPMYLDHTKIGDYTEMLARVTEVQQKFAGLPAKLRARFSNKPANLLEFLGDEENRDEAEKLGLIPPQEAQGEPEKVETPKKGSGKGKNSSAPEGSQTSLDDKAEKGEKE